MRFLFPVLLTMLLFSGLGCLEKALEYPKKTTNEQTAEQNQTISVIGVIRSIDSAANRLQIETVNGFAEEIELTSTTTVVSEKNNLIEGNLIEIGGLRDLASLIISAETIQITDLEKIKIISPNQEATIISPLIIEGFAKTANQKIYWRVKDQNNAVQLSGSNTVEGDGQNYFPFRAEIYLPALEVNKFIFEIFVKQGQTEIGLTSLTLNLLSTKKSEFQIFLANNQKNPEWSCLAVFPVARTVAETSAVGRAALIELLNGPTQDEKYQGYRSSLPLNTVITSFAISDGTATVTVSKDFNKTPACEKQRAEEQIRQTLLQIGLVDEVVIQTE